MATCTQHQLQGIHVGEIQCFLGLGSVSSQGTAMFFPSQRWESNACRLAARSSMHPVCMQTLVGISDGFGR